MHIMMLCLHTSPLAQPGSGDAGGMNVYVRQLSLHLAALGHSVEIVTAASGQDTELAPRVSVRHLGLTNHPGQALSKEELPRLLPTISGLLSTAESLSGRQTELIHSHYWLSGLVGLTLAQQWQLPLVHSMHTMAKVKNQHRAAGQSAEPTRRALGEERIVAAADRLIANTAAEAAQLAQLYGGCQDQIAVVPPGVDLETFRPPVSKINAAEDSALQIVFAGRLQRLKGPHLLLGALAQLRSTRPELRFQLTVIGSQSGKQHYDLPALAKELGVGEQVRFLEPLPPSSLAQQFAAADVVAMPSSSESFGLVALEAQACGTPVLATNVGGLSQAVIDGETGYLVNGLSESDWAAALEKIHLLGAAGRAAMGRAGVQHAGRHSWQHTAERTIEIYRSLPGATEDKPQNLG
ncbi:glycosyltransferase [Psychromicrobium lacuslunae]|uniref:D-inositol 3-phosphate glycosyltransferase n=1 Tax=Psychromicrobium lacuslunae TaxID=1618207 RepID=A0A0D4BZC8_9MICC|nr:glycosyltransferase [Psychromicrobium lacuslunae]AJT41659.1 glycosyl transferase [Psychromicrobium lacuslunae]